jgi:predicted acetyltransferase
MADNVLSTPIDAAAKKNLAEQGLRFALLTSSDKTFEPWYQAMTRGFYGAIAEADQLPSRAEGMSNRRISGLYDDAAADPAIPVATASSWIADLTIPGQRTLPAWAISTITVSPTHRRRGVARNLMEAELRTAAKLGVAAAILTASEATIYERFGFDPAAMRADYTIDTTRARWTGPIPDGTVHFVSTDVARDQGGHDIVKRALPQTPGQMYFDGYLWNRLFGMPGRANPLELRVVRYDDADGTPQGLAIYKVEDEAPHKSHTVHIEYLTTATDDAYAALWRYFLELDLVGTVKAELRSVDEPVRWQISDSRAASEDRVGDHLWLRILDVKTTLETRHYNAPGTFIFELDDPLGFAEGCWLLSIDESGRGVVTRLDDGDGFGDNHHLTMNVRELAGIYLGGTSVSTLVKAGRIIQKTPGAAVAVDAAFRSTVTPWLSTWF